MSDTIEANPQLTLVPCHVRRPTRISTISHGHVEREHGAVGVGSEIVDGAPLMFLSSHLPDGETVMAVLDVDDAEVLFHLLLRELGKLARHVPGQPVELAN
jgi:hypothetical protein